jgi:hypothetical protein
MHTTGYCRVHYKDAALWLRILMVRHFIDDQPGNDG